MAVEGSLDLFQLPEILQIISQEQKTGILTVQGQNDIVAISFLDGQVVTADALNQTLEDELGEVLITREVLSRPELEEALAEQRRTGRRLMDVLVGQKKVERQEVLEALREQTLELLSRLLHWREGEFKFYSGDEVSYEEGFRPIQVESLLLAALGEHGPAEEEGAAPTSAPASESPSPATAVETGKPDPAPAAEARSEGGGDPPAQSPEPAQQSSPRRGLLPNLEDAPLRPLEPSPAPKKSQPASAVSQPKPVTTRPQGVSPAGRKGRAKPGRRAAAAPAGRRGLGWALALIAAAGLVAVTVVRPAMLLVPFPFEEGTRLAFEDSRWSVRYARLEAALRTHVLSEGRMPEDLAVLVAAGLMSEDDIQGPLGQPLVYQAEGLTFSFRPLGSGEEVAYVGTLEGDFLLDPDVLEDESASSVRPLVLLD